MNLKFYDIIVTNSERNNDFETPTTILTWTLTLKTPTTILAVILLQDRYNIVTVIRTPAIILKVNGFPYYHGIAAAHDSVPLANTTLEHIMYERLNSIASKTTLPTLPYLITNAGCDCLNLAPGLKLLQPLIDTKEPAARRRPGDGSVTNSLVGKSREAGFGLRPNGFCATPPWGKVLRR
ncbi:hypothetical protein PT974_02519 [Cladobotryum mycophilum]|uniref:Uncharacterized protein n=1 Tax=Cladobotryum mycophilum TaxID=491253 RepID=A0ABR0SYB1_9HYPO